MGRQRTNTVKKKWGPSPQNHGVTNTSLQSKKHKDNANNCPLAVAVVSQECANCCLPIDSSTINIHDTSLNSCQNQSSAYSKNGGVNDPFNNTCDDVSEMLLAIYNLDFIPRLFQNYPDALPEGDIQLVVDLPLCFLCTNLLKPLFTLYSQFNQLRKIDSLLSQQINSLNSLINYDSQNQEFNDNNHRPTETTTTFSNSSSSRKRRAEFPSNDRGPWVKLGPRLEELTVEDIGYSPPSLRHLYQDEDVKPVVADTEPGGRTKEQEMEGRKNKTFKCSECDKEFKSKHSLQSHMFQQHTGRKIGKKNFSCAIVINEVGQVCSFRTNHLNNLKQHMLALHAEEKGKVKCVECHKLFKNKQSLITHFNITHKVRGRKAKTMKHPCTVVIKETGQICPYQTKHSFCLKRHLALVHAEEKDKVKCGECDKEMKNENCLRIHLHRVHTENGRLQCTVVDETGQTCPCTSKYSWHLKEHMLGVHAGERDKVKCGECSKKFKSEYRLKIHFRRMHPTTVLIT